jgi:hypothetical protein
MRYDLAHADHQVSPEVIDLALVTAGRTVSKPLCCRWRPPRPTTWRRTRWSGRSSRTSLSLGRAVADLKHGLRVEQRRVGAHAHAVARTRAAASTDSKLITVQQPASSTFAATVPAT